MSTQFWRDGDGYTSASKEDLSSTSVSIQMGRRGRHRSPSEQLAAAGFSTSRNGLPRAVSPPSMRPPAGTAPPQRQQSLPPWSGPRSCPKCPPPFCTVAILGCCAGMVLEVWANGWAFQPLTCPATCADGRPCDEDGNACEGNLMLGPTMAVMDLLGAKNDTAIFDRGEWWRVFACNWLHAGVFHLLFNMLAVLNLGFTLERRFGTWRIAVLYLLSGLFGTIVSIVFLPGVLSVGASASVFGLVGACWADLVINYCARCTLKESNWISLLVATALNVCIGLTPWVDNFMHMGGFVAGLVVGCVLFSKKHETSGGERRKTCLQGGVVCLGVLALVVLALGTFAAVTSTELQERFRACEWCQTINCVEISWFTTEPWWSCCIARAASGTCMIEPMPANATDAGVIAVCNMTDGLFEVPCPASDPNCAWDPAAESSTSALCARLCSGCA